MGKHEDKDKAEEERKISSNGHKPGPIPREDPGGKHEKKDEDKDKDKE